MIENKNNRNNPLDGSLAGLRVIDFTVAQAGPSCAMHLADMGAEVIRVEQPGQKIASPSREFVNHSDAQYIWHARGKKCLALDLEQPEAVQVFKDLVKVSDVVVQNHKIGVMDRLGLGYEVLSEINPGIIMASISGYGQFGPLANRPALDLVIQAQSGSAYIGGEPDGNYVPCWVSWVDCSTGTSMFAAIGAALYYREKTGKGQHLDIAMLDVAFSYNDYPFLEYLWSGGHIKRPRRGSYHPSGAPWGIFKCKDGYIAMMATQDGPWRFICELMERPDLIDDPRFNTVEHRVSDSSMDEINRLVAEWIKDFDYLDAKIILEENGIMVIPTLSIEEIVHDPQMAARNMVGEMDDPRVGVVPVPNSVFQYGGGKPQVGPMPRAPLQGEHTEEILGGVLGYSHDEIDRLRQKGAAFIEDLVSDIART